MSASDSDAVITTAASAGCGRLRNRPGTSTSIRMIRTAPTTPVSWVLAPARSATAVRDPLVLTGKPWKSPAARFAAPIPIISWLPSTSWPVRAANDRRGGDRVGQGHQRDAQAPRRTAAPRSDQPTRGMVSGGKPLRQRPDQARPRGRRGRRRVAATIASDDHDQHAGHLRQPALQDQDQRDAADPDRGGGGDRLAVGQPLDEADELADQAVGVDREAEQLRQLADQDGQREAVHVADHGGLGQQVGDEPELRHRAARTMIAPTMSASIDASAIARSGSPPAPISGSDRRRDHRPERGVRAQHEDPRRAEHRVAEQAHDRRVQAGDRRQARQLRVRHALRHQQGGQDHPGDDVLDQPLPPVGREQPKPRQGLKHRTSHPRRSRPDTAECPGAGRPRHHPPGMKPGRLVQMILAGRTLRPAEERPRGWPTKGQPPRRVHRAASGRAGDAGEAGQAQLEEEAPKVRRPTRTRPPVRCGTARPERMVGREEGRRKRHGSSGPTRPSDRRKPATERKTCLGRGLTG